jgi:hypothetical protein
MRLDLSEILSFLLLFRSYEFDLEILYVDIVGSKEHLWIFLDFFINIVSWVARWLHENGGYTGYVPCVESQDS